MNENGRPHTLCVDIGGTGIKALVVDDHGAPLTGRFREKTPEQATPEAVVAIVEKLAAQAGGFDRVSVGFPGVIKNGVVATAPNLDGPWTGFDIDRMLEARLGKAVLTENDAAVQGLGAVSGSGLEMVATLGTGLGAALYRDGKLAAGVEIAHHLFRKRRTYEECLGKKGLKKSGAMKWNRRLREAIRNWENLFHFDRLYLGGGNAGLVERPLPANVEIAPNVNGLLGGIALWKGRA
ncbi:MAG: ROK family protein [Bryobacteraceae bacterium]